MFWSNQHTFLKIVVLTSILKKKYIRFQFCVSYNLISKSDSSDMNVVAREQMALVEMALVSFGYNDSTCTFNLLVEFVSFRIKNLHLKLLMIQGFQQLSPKK